MKNKAYEFDEIAQNVFFPIYPVIAKQILNECGTYNGICLDIGSGGGHLGLCIAKQSCLKVILLDNNENAVAIADRRIREWNLTDRVLARWGDVHHIPFPDCNFDLIVSRGSMWFWNTESSTKEIYRVLKPGGTAYIGGGYGNDELRSKIYETMEQREGPGWMDSKRKREAGQLPIDFSRCFDQLGITNYTVIDNESGTWFIIRKEA